MRPPTSALLALGLALAVALPACSRPAGSPPPFTTTLTLGGRSVSPAALEHGRDVYTHFCRPCHGDAGDGKGPSAAGLRPPPRDLRLGVYKFAAVAAGQLPNDADFVRTLRSGLHGTAMLAWDVPAAELDDLINYVKAFAPRWRTETPGEALTASPDPWAGQPVDGIARGLSRLSRDGAVRGRLPSRICHRAEIFAATKELTRIDVREMRPDLYFPVAKDSDFGHKILPPDFTFNEMRGGDSVGDIYRAIAAGIGGTAMPTWKNVLPEADLWAMAHYVRSLVELRGTPQSSALHKALLEQPAWTPPPLPPADVDAGATNGAH